VDRLMPAIVVAGATDLRLGPARRSARTKAEQCRLPPSWWLNLETAPQIDAGCPFVGCDKYVLLCGQGAFKS
jgi:hypothetical protein